MYMNNVVGEKQNNYKIISLREALIQHKQIEKRRCYNDNYIDVFIKNVEKNDKLASMPIKKYVTSGASAIVFETNDGNILKLTNGSHFPLGRPIESFDVPIFESGKAGKIRYYVEEKLFQHGLSEGFVSKIKDMIREKGYKTSDLRDADVLQIGISKDGKLYLLDPECAKYKTIFHALYAKSKTLFKTASFKLLEISKFYKR